MTNLFISASFDNAIVGDILAIMLICYQVINSVKISFSGDVRGLKYTKPVGDGKSFILGLF